MRFDGALLIALMPVAAAAPSAPTPLATSCVSKSAQGAVVELLEVSGVFERARADTRDMVKRLQPENPRVPAEFWSDFAQRVADRGTLKSLYAPIYLRHLSHEDVCSLVSFYRTPAGAHFLRIDPKLEMETRLAAQRWATDVVLQLLDPSSAGLAKAPRSDAPSAAQVPAASGDTADVEELLRLSGALAAARSMISRQLDLLRQNAQAAALPASFWDEARGRLLNDEDLLRLWAPAYARQLTHAEISELLRFYRSPVGARYVAVIPAIQAESLDAGGQLGREAAKRAVREVYGPLSQWRVLHPATAPPGTHADNPPGPTNAEGHDTNSTSGAP